MNIATFVYKQYLASRGAERRSWSFLRRILIRSLNDPICSLLLHGQQLRMPLSHAGPEYQYAYPLYNRLPQRIGDYIRQYHSELICIDVGANIGDTLAAFHKKDTDIFLAIEPHPKFSKLLIENWNWNRNVTVDTRICAATSNEDRFVLQERSGTGTVQRVANGMRMSQKSLDDLVNDYPLANGANVLKIDTDGHDFEVLAGARELLTRNRPVVLFECDEFGNPHYVEDCLHTLDIFAQIGYGHFLLYDNIGNLLGRYSLTDLSPFLNLLFFQVTSDSLYYDILLMDEAEIHQFYRAEIEFFVGQMRERSLQQTAIHAIDLQRQLDGI